MKTLKLTQTQIDRLLELVEEYGDSSYFAGNPNQGREKVKQLVACAKRTKSEIEKILKIETGETMNKIRKKAEMYFEEIEKDKGLTSLFNRLFDGDYYIKIISTMSLEEFVRAYEMSKDWLDACSFKKGYSEDDLMFQTTRRETEDDYVKYVDKEFYEVTKRTANLYYDVHYYDFYRNDLRISIQTCDEEKYDVIKEHTYFTGCKYVEVREKSGKAETEERAEIICEIKDKEGYVALLERLFETDELDEILYSLPLKAVRVIDEVLEKDTKLATANAFEIPSIDMAYTMQFIDAELSEVLGVNKLGCSEVLHLDKYESGEIDPDDDSLILIDTSVFYTGKTYKTYEW